MVGSESTKLVGVPSTKYEAVLHFLLEWKFQARNEESYCSVTGPKSATFITVSSIRTDPHTQLKIQGHIQCS